MLAALKGAAYGSVALAAIAFMIVMGDAHRVLIRLGPAEDNVNGLVSEARKQVAVNGSEAHRVLLEAGLTATEARKASAEQRKFWNLEAPRLAARSEGAIDHVDALVDSLRHTSDGIDQDGKNISSAVVDTTLSLKPTLTQATMTFAQAGDVLSKAGSVIGNPEIPETLKDIHESAHQIAGITAHADNVAANIDHKVDSYLHPGFWGKVEGYSLFALDLVKDIIQTKVALDPIPISIRTAR